MCSVWNRETFQQLVRCTQRAAEETAAAVRSGAAAVGHRTDEAVTCARLRRRSRELQGEIDRQLQEVGMLLYATHCGNPTDSDAIQVRLEAVDQLQEDLAECQRAVKRMNGVLFCDSCGAENAGTNVYCHNCGRPLSR